MLTVLLIDDDDLVRVTLGDMLRSLGHRVTSPLPGGPALEAVKAGGDRQEIHEAIRVHAREAARVVKMEGGKNPLRDLLHGDPAFAKVAQRIDSLLDPVRYIGRAPQQVDEYLAEEVAPILARHASLLGAKGKVEV